MNLIANTSSILFYKATGTLCKGIANIIVGKVTKNGKSVNTGKTLIDSANKEFKEAKKSMFYVQ